MNNNTNNTAAVIKENQKKIANIRKYSIAREGQPVKWADMLNKKAVLMENDMHVFINGIAKEEMFEKLQTIYDKSDDKLKQHCVHLHSKYIKTVRNSMIRNGFEQRWVDTTFMTALNNRIPKVS